MIIAMDGTVASGKGTLARRLAQHYGLAHLDTGSLYRAVGVAALDWNVALDDAWALAAIARTMDPSAYPDARLRTDEAGMAASRVAALQPVRDALLAFQRDFARRPEGAILDGRDIGTVICPDADVKFWVDASIPVRAARRWKELVQRDPAITLEQVRADLEARDARDRGRTIAPMMAAPDAHLLDTSDLSIDAAVEKACRVVDQALAGKN